MRLPVPQNALALAVGGLALVIATTGTAVAATGTSMNITDPTNSARKAKVDATGRLLVADGAGPMTVDGSVQAREADPAGMIQDSAALYAPAGNTSCQRIFSAPPGKAAVLRSLTLSTSTGTPPSYGIVTLGTTATSCEQAASRRFRFYIGTGTPGNSTVPLEPGLAVPAGSSLYFTLYASAAEASITFLVTSGYSVPASAVPPPPAEQRTAPAPPRLR